jgi:anti-sigma B factor antagonist
VESLRIERAHQRVWLHGELDLAAFDDVLHTLAHTLAELDGQTILLDLAGVTFIDSTGLRTLMAARRDHAQLSVVNPSGVVVRLLDMTGTSELVLGEPKTNGAT